MKHNPPKQFTVISSEKPLVICVFHDGQTSHPQSGCQPKHPETINNGATNDFRLR